MQPELKRRKIPKKQIETHDYCQICNKIRFKLELLFVDSKWLCKTCYENNIHNFVINKIKKYCKKCRQLLNLDNFSIDKSKKDKKHSVCKECKLEYRKFFKRNKIVPCNKPTKECIHCKQEKELKFFNKRLSNIDGLSGECKECRWELDKKWRDNNPDKNKNKWLKRKYGITLEDYKIILNEQNNACYICDRINTEEKPLHVDHCHKTGKVRRLLCMHCNQALGSCFEDIDILYKMIEYLKENYE